MDKKIATLNLALTALKDSYDIVERYGGVENVNMAELGANDGIVVRQNLMRIEASSRIVGETLESVMFESSIPVQQANPKLLKFYKDTFKPRESYASRLLFPEIFEFSEGLNLSPYECGRSTSIKNTFEWAMDDHDTTLIYNPEFENWEESVEEMNSARRLMKSVYFDPDQWLDNIYKLEPVYSAKDVSAIPAHVRTRLTEVYRSFVFGNWMSCIAISRALLEYALIDRRSKLKIDAYKESTDGRMRTRSLNDLIQQASDAMPEYKDDMEAIQGYGNDVMHPEKTKKVRAIVLGEKQATDCVGRIQRVISELYL